jgi:hypothetical protein
MAALGAAGAMLAVWAATGPASAASGPAPAALIPVAQGVQPAALPGSTVFGTTPADTPEAVSFILKARDGAQLEQSVEAGMPGGHLSVGQFARTYGQPAENIAALTAYLGQFGISTSAYPDGLDVSASGTAGQFDQALSVQQRQYSVPATPGRDGQPGTRTDRPRHD